jgi:maspardin
MRKRLKWLIPLVLVMLISAVYLYPVPRKSFAEIYAKAPPEATTALVEFRENHPLQTVEVDGITWEYVAFGEGTETVVFLHGMTGAYDIWWAQMEAMAPDYRVISTTYPPIKSLAAMGDGVLAILDQEGVEKANLVGSSLGGYFVQYLVGNYPERVERAVFANTFPPNDLLAEQTKTIGALLPYLPEWLVLSVLRGSFRESVYPASGNSELVLAYMLEQSYGRMNKAQVMSRFHAVIDPFTAPNVTTLGIPVLIIEADNDPLVDSSLRDALKTTYPTATVHTLPDVGHFPYINEAETYTWLLKEFFDLTPEN